jgi:hypothetical protein
MMQFGPGDDEEEAPKDDGSASRSSESKTEKK